MADEPELQLTAEEKQAILAARARVVAEAKAKKDAAAASAAGIAKAKADAERRAVENAASDKALSGELRPLATTIVESVRAIGAAIWKAQELTAKNGRHDDPRDMTEFAGYLAAALEAVHATLPDQSNLWTLKHAVDRRSPAMSMTDPAGTQAALTVTTFVLDAVAAATRGPDYGALKRAAYVFPKHRTMVGAKRELDEIERADAKALAHEHELAHQKRLEVQAKRTQQVTRSLAPPRPPIHGPVALHEGETILGDELPRVQ